MEVSNPVCWLGISAQSLTAPPAGGGRAAVQGQGSGSSHSHACLVVWVVWVGAVLEQIKATRVQCLFQPFPLMWWGTLTPWCERALPGFYLSFSLCTIPKFEGTQHHSLCYSSKRDHKGVTCRTQQLLYSNERLATLNNLPAGKRIGRDGLGSNGSIQRRATTFCSPVLRSGRVLATDSQGPAGHGSGEPYKGWRRIKDIHQFPDFQAELHPQTTQQFAEHFLGCWHPPLSLLLSRCSHNSPALGTNEATRAAARPTVRSLSLLELYLKFAFKQHLSNPSVQKYFILLWELYVFPSSKEYKI